MVYLGFCIVLFICDRLTLRRTLEKLRRFEADAEAYDDSLGTVGENTNKVPLEAIKGL